MSGCARKTGDGEPALQAQVAGFDMAAGDETRFLLGVLTGTGKFLAGGTVKIAFHYLGPEPTDEKTPVATATARFLAVHGTPPQSGGPRLVGGSSGRGVYAAKVKFDRPGFWEARMSARLDGAERTAEAAFQVLDRHRVPAVGDPAPAVENLVLPPSGVDPKAIDSRAAEGAEVPDPELHQMKVADALAQHRPILLVISTPAYCQSRFCGPVTDLVAELAKEYPNRAAYIHVELWRDFQARQINKAAADWIYRDDNVQEPWVFLIGADGKIAARWDNVATREEIEPLLAALPQA